MTPALIVPIKSPGRAKSRLDAVLAEWERARLARTMTIDVLTTLRGLSGVRCYAVSDDEDVLELAQQFGAIAVHDRDGSGQSAAVRQGFRAAWAEEPGILATIPGDVPGASREELTRLLHEQAEYDVVLVPDRDGVGTNGLRLRTSDAISLHFGDDSLRLHREEALRNGLSVGVLTLPRLACDLDRPADLDAFLGLAPATVTLDLLRELGVAERLKAGNRPRG